MKTSKELRYAILATGVIIQCLATGNVYADVDLEKLNQLQRLEDLNAQQRMNVHQRIKGLFKVNPNFNPALHEFLIDSKGVIYVTDENNEVINLESIIASPSCPGSD